MKKNNYLNKQFQTLTKQKRRQYFNVKRGEKDSYFNLLILV